MNKYLITSREFYTDTPAVFRSILHKQFVKHSPSYALYRDKSNPNYDEQASHFIEVCNQFENIKSFIHQDIDLALKLQADGVHLTSNQFDKIQKAKDTKLEVIISTHSHEEVLKAQEYGVDAVTYSPVFVSPNKGKAKGIEDLKELLCKCDTNIFALGGIVEDFQINQIKEIGVFGFASIRYFY